MSGYLITSIILTEKQAGTFSLLSFYGGRHTASLVRSDVCCLPFAVVAVAWTRRLFSLIAVSTFRQISYFGEKVDILYGS